MKDYKKIFLEEYCVEKIDCVCQKCQKEFFDIIPFGYELVSFCVEGGERVFLPTYGKNGYLYLLKELVPEWNENKEINYTIIRLFENRICKYTPYKITTNNKTLCPQCKSDLIKIFKRTTVENYPVKWMEIDRDILV